MVADPQGNGHQRGMSLPAARPQVRRLVLLACAALLVALLGASQNAHAQGWPARPVKFIAPFAAGGTSDILGRIVAEHLPTLLHQEFYVENRAGAGGLIGSKEVATAAPDGYTFVIS